MTDPAIRIQHLGKRYRIGADRTYKALRDSLAGAFTAPRRLARRLISGLPSAPAATNEFFWALKNVSFDIAAGEAVGIIGRNGAGKSTLLKILSRITDPTEGRVEIEGRVGSLLEVGTGFHPELSGRENIYLNGAILGMRRADITRRFDEIVAFAEVEQFLDTPVKRYSSGMYMRLAFAVAAHLEPEVLVVDEVLAVGDAEFQKKCLGKMSEVASHGRTVLFVSHNMEAITRLCSKAVLLRSGQVAEIGEATKVAATYLRSGLGTSAEARWDDPATAPGDAVARLKSVKVISEGVVTETVDIRKPVMVEMEYWNQKAGAILLSAFTFQNDQGLHLFVSPNFSEPGADQPRPVGLYHARCTVPGNLFSEGTVRVVAEVSTRYPVLELHVLELDSVAFTVVDRDEPGSVRSGWGRPLIGAVRPMLEWKTEHIVG